MLSFRNMSSDKHLFVTGIGTGVGKTIVSAVLTQYLQAAYWKPVQAGDLHQSDSMLVRNLTDPHLTIFPERYRLQLAASPHQAAAAEGISILLSDFALPECTGPLIVEGAGGLFVPLNNRQFMIDLIARFQLPAVLVARDYLGCINHTLLSLRALQQRGIPIRYLVLNGTFNPATKEILMLQVPTGTQVIGLPELKPADKDSINHAMMLFNKQVKK
jgi:dethiobiotin synthetase